MNKPGEDRQLIKCQRVYWWNKKKPWLQTGVRASVSGLSVCFSRVNQVDPSHLWSPCSSVSLVSPGALERHLSPSLCLCQGQCCAGCVLCAQVCFLVLPVVVFYILCSWVSDVEERLSSCWIYWIFGLNWLIRLPVPDLCWPSAAWSWFLLYISMSSYWFPYFLYYLLLFNLIVLSTTLHSRFVVLRCCYWFVCFIYLFLPPVLLYPLFLYDLISSILIP